MAPSEPSLAITPRLAAAELADAEALVRDAGWNQTATDWQIFREFGTVYSIHSDSGRVIATAATLPYGDQFGWISMVLVAKEFQRRGFATRLLRRCIDDLLAARQVPVLDATPAGREVYRQLGFKDSWGFTRYAASEARAAPTAAETAGGFTVSAITDDVWAELCAYDAKIFGADRAHLLARLRARLPQAALVARREGRVVGFLLGRNGRVATQLGPLVAEDDAVAQALLGRALAAIDGPVFIDVPDGKNNLTAWLAARGFAAQRSLTRMLRGRATAFDDGRRTFAVVGPEFG